MSRRVPWNPKRHHSRQHVVPGDSCATAQVFQDVWSKPELQRQDVFWTGQRYVLDGSNFNVETALDIAAHWFLPALYNRQYNRHVFAPLSSSKTSRLSGTAWSQREMKKWNIEAIKISKHLGQRLLDCFHSCIAFDSEPGLLATGIKSLPNAHKNHTITYDYYTFFLTQILAKWDVWMNPDCSQGKNRIHNNWPHEIVPSSSVGWSSSTAWRTTTSSGRSFMSTSPFHKLLEIWISHAKQCDLEIPIAIASTECVHLIGDHQRKSMEMNKMYFAMLQRKSAIIDVFLAQLSLFLSRHALPKAFRCTSKSRTTSLRDACVLEVSLRAGFGTWQKARKTRVAND